MRKSPAPQPRRREGLMLKTVLGTIILTLVLAATWLALVVLVVAIVTKQPERVAVLGGLVILGGTLLLGPMAIFVRK